MVYRMFFLGRNVVYALLFTLKPKNLSIEKPFSSPGNTTCVCTAGKVDYNDGIGEAHGAAWRSVDDRTRHSVDFQLHLVAAMSAASEPQQLGDRRRLLGGGHQVPAMAHTEDQLPAMAHPGDQVPQMAHPGNQVPVMAQLCDKVPAMAHPGKQVPKKIFPVICTYFVIFCT